MSDLLKPSKNRLDLFKLRAEQFRQSLEHRPTARRIFRTAVGVVGTLVLIGGIVAIPYPGPGWLIVFAGLAILASEFAWARRVLRFARGKYDAWTAWLARQHAAIRIAVWTGTCLIVLATLWLLGVFALVGGWVGIEWTWLRSPILG